MSTFYEFATTNPFLTFILACIICQTLISIARAIRRMPDDD